MPPDPFDHTQTFLSSDRKAMFAELSNYLDDELDDSLCEELERHLGGCKPCKAFLSSLEATIDQVPNLSGEGPST